ncbi:VOC family protein [Pseudonocardia kujensis]|uniref:VOC family protein n=1 Tax=Pseudonocardia kujensis TaxID=1128675 RepID=UPI001E5FE1B0|nr:VOC family protein [Pseudonocardia kujensis]MCE0763313.1 VOC family protein [Pseudonocardia kujensis]
MALHRLTRVTIGVPAVAETVGYYTEFGLEHLGGGAFASRDGGEQLRIVPARTRRLVELGVGCDDRDDVARIAARLERRGLPRTVRDDTLTAVEPVVGFEVTVAVAPRLAQSPAPTPPYNGPGRVERRGRAPGVLRTAAVRPRRLGHAVVGTVDLATTVAFFVDVLGFRVSDHIGTRGAFLRCSTDHHNVLALAAPVNFLHHTSWQVDDVDDVGRGAKAMLEADPARHVWGLGRHHAGSNFFWYLKDPAGNFSEYYADMDVIGEDETWTPEVFEGAQGLFDWGPPPPPSFLEPDDLAALMTGLHASGR